jgi:hypothetical protein
MKLLTLYLFSFIVLVGCAQQITLINQFNEGEARNALQAGKNSIKGSALIKQNNGGTVTCAGTSVRLIPVTAYSSERIYAIYKSTDRGFNRVMFAPTGSPFANDNPAFYQVTKETACDAQGFFKFDAIADGDFFVVTSVRWSPGGYTYEGGTLMRRVSLKGGETREIVLAP